MAKKSKDDDSVSSSSSSSSSSASSQGDDHSLGAVSLTKELTAAELMRKNRVRRNNGGKGTNNTRKKELEGDSESEKEKVDIDDEIKRLEAELADDSDSSSSDDSDDDSDDDSSSDDEERKARPKKKIKFGETTVLNKEELESMDMKMNMKLTKESVICASECAEETIAPLPVSALPKCKSKKLKIDFEGDEVDKEGLKKSKKRKRSSNNKDGTSTTTEASDGLRQAVMEVLSGYVPRSSERLPFYCRVCSHQSANEEEFIAHKKSEFCKAATLIERKKTYCKLCRKQFTSIVQMREHLKSKPHKEKLEQMRARQRGEPMSDRGRGGRGYNSGRGGGRGYNLGRGFGRGYNSGRGGRGGRGFGAGRQGRWHNRRDQSSMNNRQWC